MAAYAIVDVDVHDIEAFMRYQKKVAPLLEGAGARYLARGGELRVYQGDYEPGRLILLEFPSLDVMDTFYNSSRYKALAPERDACSSCRVLAVQGLEESG
ncbi:MAG: DUF1330 domain-containing protein [Halioglobus sp.]|nr:DUF1330 domain-containing protein [Halioglobus sp.]